MKFQPEILLKIFLDGNLTPEAQSEFDKLVRQDPLFAEKVTESLAEKLGTLPDSQVEAMAARLEPKMADIWRSAQPRPWNLYLQLAWKILLVLAAFGAMGYSLWTLLSNPSISVGANSSKEEPLSLVVLQDEPAAQSFRKKTPVVSAGPVSSLNKPSRESQLTPEPRKSTGLAEEGNFIRMAVHVEKTQPVLIKILDSNGMPVRALYKGVWKAGDHTLDWDGKDDQGRELSPGNYQVTLLSAGKTQSTTVHLQQAP